MIEGHGTGQGIGHGLANWPARGQSLSNFSCTTDRFPRIEITCDIPTSTSDSHTDFTNKRPCRETKHPNAWKELSKLPPPEPAAKSKGSGIVSVDRLKKSLDDSKSSFIVFLPLDFTGQILQSMWRFWSKFSCRTANFCVMGKT
jgi:hypothetical protein